MFKKDFPPLLQKGTSIVTTTIKNFIRDDCYFIASALSFYTVQSIVPLLAFFLGIAKGFGFENYLENLLTNSIPSQKEIMTHALQFADSLLKVSREGVIIGIGVAFLLYATINLMYYIEQALNQILKIQKQRTLFRKFTDYIAIILFSILTFVLLTSIGLFINSEIKKYAAVSLLDNIGYFLSVFKIESWILSCFLFFILFYLMPNTRMRLWPTLIGAIIAGLTFQLTQFLFVNVMSKFFNYNLIYGSLSVLPIFLIWVLISWLIALFCFELVASIENDYLKEPTNVVVNKRQLTFLIISQCLERFYSSLSPLTDFEITQKLKTSLDATRSILDMLVKGEVLSPIEKEDGSRGFQPYCSPEKLTIKQICDVIEKSSDMTTSAENSPRLKKIRDYLEQSDKTLENSPSNITIKKFLFDSLKDRGDA